MNRPSLFLYFLSRELQRQEIDVILIESVIEVNVPPLGRAPHREKPNVLCYFGSVFRIAREDEFRTLGELISTNRVELELGKVLLEAGIFNDRAIFIQAL